MQVVRNQEFGKTHTAREVQALTCIDPTGRSAGQLGRFFVAQSHRPGRFFVTIDGKTVGRVGGRPVVAVSVDGVAPGDVDYSVVPI